MSQEFVFFWKHFPAPDGALSPACFSQWWEGAPFILKGERFLTAEHYMMAAKARISGDFRMADRIIQSRSAQEAKRYGRIAAYNEQAWRRHREGVVFEGNLAKFTQHPELADYLLATGDAILAEASPFDRVWGIGLGEFNGAARQPALWQGENLLGIALMEVRSFLRGERHVKATDILSK
jgi:ribA/ribD-fused uncharacterized protein